jgi:hypothetical protein
MIPLLQLPKEERIESCRQDRWIEYPLATAVLSALDELIAYPKTQRAHCMLLTGSSNNGKSALISEFRRRHPTRIAADGTLAFCMASIEMPGKPDESSVITEILRQLRINHPIRATAAGKRPLLLRTVEQCNVRTIFMDEFNHINDAGKGGGPLLGFIKTFADATGVNIVAMGTASAKNALLIDPQLYTRFKIVELPSWGFNTEYLGFLAGYERILPLALPSGLAKQELAPHIFRLAGAETRLSFMPIGSTVEVVKGLAAYAIKTGRECIDFTTIQGWEAENAIFQKT